MAHIYWELHEIPRPKGSYINHSDGRVFLMSNDGSGKARRKVIGHATSETMMHPNDMYRYLYPSEWERQYHEKSFPAHELHMGMYMLSLGIGHTTNLYPILHEIYGPLYANAVMDYAMYFISDRSDTTQLFEERMPREVLYSKEAYSDSWYSEMFHRHMSEEANHQFCLLWLKECQRNGITKAWLSMDGSNNDCSISEEEIFGIRSEGRIFHNYPDEAYLYLYYDGANGTDRSAALVRKVLRGAEKMRQSIADGEKPVISKGLGSYLGLKEDGAGYLVEYKFDAWQKAVNEKGFYSIASSRELEPSKIHEVYHLRDASEKQFMIMKSQLGFDVARVHSVNSLMGKFAVCFVAAILRFEIMTACHKLELPAASETQAKRRPGRPPKQEKNVVSNEPRRKSGRPKGSKNKKTLEREATMTMEQPKRRPGRPKGSKNKKTLEQEALATQQKKRKPGRPKGSKNKPKQ